MRVLSLSRLTSRERQGIGFLREADPAVTKGALVASIRRLRKAVAWFGYRAGPGGGIYATRQELCMLGVLAASNGSDTASIAPLPRRCVGDDVKVADFSRGEAAHGTQPRAEAWSAPSRYQPSQRPRWISLGLIAVMHVAGFLALQYAGPVVIQRVPSVPLVVDLLPLDPPPPEPKAVTLPTKLEVAPRPIPQRIVAPVPIVKTPPAPVIVETRPVPEPAPPPPVMAVEARPAPARTSAEIVNLNTRLLSAEPPRYPVEARRRRETGTVILLVVVDQHGRVAEISVATSSGVDRLDKAALSAVRRWRWSPMIVDGHPSKVKGLVRIPFELTPAS